MRKELHFLVYTNACILLFIVYYTFDLLTLCIDDTQHEALLDVDLNNQPYDILSNSSYSENSTINSKPQLIPKIIHQTYKTEDIPSQWIESQKKCKDLHPDYKYILWTDAMAREFIREEYPWFLDTFESYKYPIERADAIRYFILSHFGGIYIDLDDGCERRLDPLLTVPAFVRKTSPTGISNDVMGSVPRHPFYLKLIKSLKHYNKNWYIPYMTIMGSTGPLFVSVVWKQYKRWGRMPANGIVRILQPADYKSNQNSFFSIAKGSSWHTDDASFMKSLGNHILSCVVAGFVFGFFVLYFEYCFYCWLCSNNNGNSLLKRFGKQLQTFLVFMFESVTSRRSYDTSYYNDHTQSSVMFDPSVKFNKCNDSNYSNEFSSKKRSRKDSNLPFHNVISDLEKNDPKFTDLS